MPWIMDRYLLRQFVQVFFICFLSLTGLYVVIDAFGHLDHFVDYASEHGNLFVILGEYYAYRSLAFFDRTSGVLALIAAMFTVTWIQRHHEMTALLAAGVSRLRVLRPILLAAVAVSFLAAANRELFIPSVREHLAVDSKNLGGERESMLHPRFDNQTDILITGDKVIPNEQLIVRPNFVLPADLALYGKQLTAEEGVYEEGDAQRPSGYRLRRVSSPKLLLEEPTLALSDGTPAVLTPSDAPWLGKDELFVISDVAFEFLTAGTTWRDFASTRELVTQLSSPSTDLGDDVRVAVHGRVMQPFLDTTLLFLGLPFVVSRSNRNPFIAIGICLGVVTAFMLVVLGCQSLGISGWIEPALAVWLPLMIFAPLAVGMSEPLRK